MSAKSRKLRLLDVNAYLRKTLKLKKDPVKSKSDVVETWERLFPKIMSMPGWICLKSQIRGHPPLKTPF